ncbi:DUF1642 domain-containing protein [Streptococcus koreensis]|uniref:DUF1642 domain-containing protein n=1 Tax=Streptococcus koreensis TaxID=2382163 RepID=UPI0022E12A64|nr:DUF1642 domain-containing protein [Streptococcus koreensis]
MNKQELIEEIEDLKELEKLFGNNPNYIKIDTVIRLISKLDEPQPLKLKDVIKRIEGFNLGTQKVWLDEILHELGSDYGSVKYKDGYEQGKLEGEWVGQQLKDADKIRQELNKPVIPQFVADWYEENKDDFENALFRSIDLLPSTYEEGEFSEFEKWLADEHTKPFQILVNMHQFGYTVEKEKRYLVKVNAENCSTKYLVFGEITGSWFFAHDKYGNVIIKHTRKELEEAGFDWVFNCPGVEIEEVEG